MSHTILVSKLKWPFLSLIDTYLDYIYYILISDSLKFIDADIHIKELSILRTRESPDYMCVPFSNTANIPRDKCNQIWNHEKDTTLNFLIEVTP